MKIKETIQQSDNIVRLSTLIENIRLGVMIQDQDHHILLVNQLFCDIFELAKAPSELGGIDHNALLEILLDKFKDSGAFKDLLKTALKSDKKIEKQVFMLDNGCVVEIDIIPIQSESENIGCQWNIRDISERYYTQTQLKESEKKYLSIIENMQLGLLETDHKGTILKVNKSLCDILGFETKELIDSNIKNINALGKQNSIAKPALIENDLKEVCLLKKSGDKVWCIMGVAPFQHINLPDRYLYVFLDISNQKHLEKELIKAKEEAESARYAEQEFLAQMSHEIRTPLNAVIGMAHLLLDTNPSKEQRAYLDTLNNAANILHGLISDILDISKIESGAIEIRNSQFDLNGLIESIGQTFSLKSANKPVELILNLDNSLKNYLIGDEMLLTQILLNLTSNAFKFTEEGEIRIVSEKTRHSGNEVDIKLTISDSGIGIKEEKLETIFESFKQADRDIGIKYGGSGLGLSITRKLIEILNGSINVKSAEGEGTQFHLQFTFQDSGEPIRKLENSIPASVKPFLQEASNILVVEDNLMNQSYISSIIGDNALSIDFANNGLEGVNLAQNKKYDLILMDIRMPELDGYETSIRIRNSKNPNLETPIIALTASAMEVEKHRAMDSGMNDFLTKPFTPKELNELLSKYIGKKNEGENSPSGFNFSDTFDSDKLEELYEGDLETVLLMFDSFILGVAGEIPELEKKALAGNWQEVQDLSHKFMPAFAMVGLPQIHKDLRWVEDQCKAGQYEEILPRIKSVVHKVRDVMPLVKKEKERLEKHITS